MRPIPLIQFYVATQYLVSVFKAAQKQLIPQIHTHLGGILTCLTLKHQIMRGNEIQHIFFHQILGES